MRLISHPAGRCVILVFFTIAVLWPGIPFRMFGLAGIAVVISFAECGCLTPLGLDKPRLRHTAFFAILGFAAAVAVGELFQPMIERIFGIETDYSGYGSLAGNLPAAARLLLFAWTSAAICEELVFRGFILYQLTALLGRSRPAISFAIGASAILFGLAHWQQGAAGIVSTGVIGLMFALLFFRSNKNLWSLMLAHALIDTFGVATLYMGRYS